MASDFDLAHQFVPDARKLMARGMTRLWRVYRTEPKAWRLTAYLGEIYAPFEWVAHAEACAVFGAVYDNDRRTIRAIPGLLAANEPEPFIPPPRSRSNAGLPRTFRRKPGALSVLQADAIRALIMEHLVDRVTLAEMADRIGLKSRPRLVEGFALVTGMTPHQWQIFMRLERARRLLETTDWDVGRISAAVGYPRYPAFARVFRQKFQQTATEWRENARRRRSHRRFGGFY